MTQFNGNRGFWKKCITMNKFCIQCKKIMKTLGFCSNECRREFTEFNKYLVNYKIKTASEESYKMLKRFPIGTKVKTEPTSYRKLKKEKCTDCGIEDKRLLIVHHKDGNRKNNKESNLVTLCWNCHFKAHNYNWTKKPTI